MSVMKGEHQNYSDGPLIDGFSSIVSAANELKSPLSLIRQLSLLLESEDVSVGERKKMLRQISLTSERVLRLTSDLTRSINLTDAMFKLEPINPRQLCEDIICELEPLFAANNRELKLISSKHPLLVVANRDLLRRIILNFSDNALHYTEDNKVIEIKIGSCNSGRTIRLSVRDHGPAISPDIFKKLNTQSRVSRFKNINARPRSSGLGLFVAGQFAEAMNGKLGVKKHRDGSTFFIDLHTSHQLSLL